MLRCSSLSLAETPAAASWAVGRTTLVSEFKCYLIQTQTERIIIFLVPGHGGDRCAAWLVNPSHNPKQLNHWAISRKLRLLEGNLARVLLPDDWKRMNVSKGDGQLYVVEWRAALWSNGYRFFRNCGLCCEHPYRQEGASHANEERLVPKESGGGGNPKCVRNVSRLRAPMHKPRACLRTIDYRFIAHGPATLVMSILKLGRKRMYHATTPSSSTERMLRLRQLRKKGGEQRSLGRPLHLLVSCVVPSRSDCDATSGRMRRHRFEYA